MIRVFHACDLIVISRAALNLIRVDTRPSNSELLKIVCLNAHFTYGSALALLKSFERAAGYTFGRRGRERECIRGKNTSVF